MRWLADFVYLFVGLMYLPVALYHALILGKNRRGWGQRFDAVPELPSDRTKTAPTPSLPFEFADCGCKRCLDVAVGFHRQPFFKKLHDFRAWI